MRWPLLALVGVLALAGAAGAAGPYGGTVYSLALSADAGAPRFAATELGLFAWQEDEWTRVAGLARRDLRTVAELAPPRLLVLPRHGPPLASSDGGVTWNEASEGLRSRFGRPVDEVLSLAVAVDDRDHLVLGTAGAGPFHSRDGGRTWQSQRQGLEDLAPPALHAPALLPARGVRPLLMGTAGLGLFAWRDERWQAVAGGLPDGLRVQALAADPADPAHLALASRNAGLWESVDAGATWRQLWRGRFQVVSAVAIGAGGTVAAFFPDEGLVLGRGGTVRAGTLPAALRVSTLRPAGNGWWAGLEHDGVARLGADGGGVEFVNRGLLATRIAVAVAGTAPGTWWCGDANGVFFSADGGAHWEPRDTGLVGAATTALLWLDGSLYRGSGGQGVYRYDPAQHAWQARSAGLGTANTIFSLVASADGARLYVGTEGGVLRSDDRAAHWAHKDQGLPLTSVWRVATDPADPARVWALGQGQLFASRDAGEHWARVADPGPGNAVVADPTGRDPAALVVGERQVVRVTEDSATETVFTAPSGARLRTARFDDRGELWVAGDGGAWVVSGGHGTRVAERPAVTALFAGDGGVGLATAGDGVLQPAGLP